MGRCSAFSGRGLALLALLSALAGSAALADDTGALRLREHVTLAGGGTADVGDIAMDGADSVVWTVILPDDVAEGARPLVVFLHGSGAPPDPSDPLDSRGLYSLSALTREGVREEYPALLLVPRMPVGRSWREDYERAVPALMELVREVILRYPVNRERVYLVAEGEGAEAGRRLLAVHGNWFAAGVLIAGVRGPERAARLTDLPLWVFHGARDELVPVDGPRALVSAIWAAGGRRVRYTEFAETGHAAWVAAWEEARLLPWLFSQTKE